MKTRRMIALIISCICLLTFVACTGTQTPDNTTTDSALSVAADSAAAGLTAGDADSQTQADLLAATAIAAGTEAAPLTSATQAAATQAAATQAAATKAATTKAATTKAATTKAANNGKTKWEINVAGVRVPVAGAKVLRAWKAEQNGVSVDAYRMEYGARHDTSGSSGSTNVANVQPVITVAVINATPDHIHTTTARQALGKPLATVEEVARAVEPLIGINIAYWFNSANPRFVVDCPVVVGGKLVQPGTVQWPSLNIYEDGTWEFDPISPANVQAKLARGLVLNVVDQHVPIQNGVRTYAWGNGNGNGGDNEPYAFIGQIDKDTYVLAAGEFMNRNDMVDVLIDFGVQTALEVNGGNSAMIYLKGVGNAPNPNTDAKNLVGLNKLNMTDNEHQYLLGIFGGKGRGGVNATIDFIYFK